MPEVQHDPTNQRFTHTSEGKTARIDYRMKGDDQIAFLHTETPKELQGRGIASRMAEVALDYALTREFQVLPYCPFIREFIQDHPKYQGLVPEDFSAG